MEWFLIWIAAFVGGLLISFANYLLLRRLIASRGDTGVSLASPIRAILSAAYLVLLYFIGKRTELSSGPLLIGGALGLTVGLFYFTARLTQEAKEQASEKPKGKGKKKKKK